MTFVVLPKNKNSKDHSENLFKEVVDFDADLILKIVRTWNAKKCDLKKSGHSLDDHLFFRIERC